MRFRGDILIIICFLYSASFADDLLYRYEGDVLPYDESAGWELFNPCGDKGQCSESIENGHLVLRWPQASDLVNYNLWIARPGEAPPPRCG